VDSYACKVYVRLLIEKFVETYFNEDQDELEELK